MLTIKIKCNVDVYRKGPGLTLGGKEPLSVTVTTALSPTLPLQPPHNLSVPLHFSGIC